jgi:hypothetical protein
MLTGRGARGSKCRAALAGAVGIVVMGISVAAWAQNGDIGRGSGAQDGRARSVRLGDVSVTVQSHSVSGTVSVSGADRSDYWTAERMAGAKAKVLAVPLSLFGSGSATTTTNPPDAPGFVHGQPPSRPFGASEQGSPGLASEGVDGDLTQLMDMTAPGNHEPPSDANYPFVGWRWFTPLQKYPLSAIGKLFFTQLGLNYVCSASSIGPRHVATAAHCLHAGNNSDTGFSSNVLFCPQYLDGVAPTVGCWSVPRLWVKNSWYTSQNVDRDFGGGVASPSGTVLNQSLGSATGWLGYSWNFSNPVVLQFGYSSASPFNGQKLIVCATAVKSYMDFGGGADSPIVGCHQRPGSSGGPWILGFGPTGSNPNATTHNWLNGVNSRIFCSSGCTGSNYINKWSSPGFSSEAGGAKEFYDFLLTR